MRFVHRHFVERHRDVGALREVVRDELVVVHLVHVVTGEDQHEVCARLFDEVRVLRHRVRRPAVPVGALASEVWLEQRHAAALTVEIPRPSDADVVV